VVAGKAPALADLGFAGVIASLDDLVQATADGLTAVGALHLFEV
jgi:hypothetical protein